MRSSDCRCGQQAQSIDGWVEDYVRGSATADMANRLGLTMSAAQELARAGGHNGAAGILIGVLLSSK
jgi:hypothetical protein